MPEDVEQGHLELPVLGQVHLPSAFLFDIGVFVLVVGATTLLLIAIAHQSLRARRMERERRELDARRNASSIVEHEDIVHQPVRQP